MLSNVWHSGVMVGRFNVRPGTGDNDWSIWDNAANGQRGSGLSEQQARAEAADLELQYDAHGYRPPETVRRVDPPVPVERAWQPVGVRRRLGPRRWPLGRPRQARRRRSLLGARR